MKLKFVVSFIIIIIFPYIVYNAPGEIQRTFKGTFLSSAAQCNIAVPWVDFYGNPALTGGIKFSSKLKLNYQTRYSEIENSTHYNYLSFYRKLDFLTDRGLRIGVGYMNFILENIEERDIAGNLQSRINDDETLTLLNLSFPLLLKKPKFNNGFNFKYYSHKIGQVSAKTYDIDYGISYRYRSLSAGLVFKNILENSVKFINTAEPVPRSTSMGLSYIILKNKKYCLTALIDSIFYSSIDNDFSIGSVMEFKNLYGKDIDFKILTGFDNQRISASLGFELFFKKRLTAGFAYQMMKQKELGDNFNIGISWEFAGAKEERMLKYNKFEDMGFKYFKRGEWQLAKKYWETSIKYYPGKHPKAEAWLQLVDYNLTSEKNKIQQYKQEYTELFEKGEKAYLEDKYIEALNYLTRINDQPYTEISLIFKKSQELIKKIYDKKFRIEDSEYKTGYYFIAKSLFRNGLYDEALSNLRLAKESIEPEKYKELDIQINKKIIEEELDKKRKLEVKEKLQQAREKFANNKMQDVVDICDFVLNNFKENEPGVESIIFLKNEALKRLKIAGEEINKKIKTKKSKSLKDIEKKKELELKYENAVGYFFQFLKNKDVESLKMSIHLYKEILDTDPYHRCRSDYEKALKLMENPY